MNSLGLFPRSLADIILQICVFLLIVAMAAMGLMVDLTVIRKTGLKALSVALLVFCLFVAFCFTLTTFLNHF